MNSFLNAEWKTIVGVTAFCGAIFGWFYHRELAKEEAEHATYPFECLRAGEGLFDTRLGTPYSDMSKALGGFVESDDAALGVRRFESPDRATAYHFRNDRLSAIEYYPDMDQLDKRCAADHSRLMKSKEQVAAPLSHANRTHEIYEGFVVVKESDSAQNSDENAENSVQESQMIGWIIVPI